MDFLYGLLIGMMVLPACLGAWEILRILKKRRAEK